MSQGVSKIRKTDNTFHLELGREPEESDFILKCYWSNGHSQAEFRLPSLTPPVDKPPRERAEIYGRALFKALFPSPIEVELKRAKEVYRQELILRLSIPPDLPGREELEQIAWEYACDPQSDEFLGLSRRLILVRDLGQAEEAPLLEGSPPIRVLVAWADPEPTNSVQPDAELKVIRQAWGDQAQIYELPRATFPRFCERVRELSTLDRLHVVHFIGHAGCFCPEANLIFHGPNGTKDCVPASKFATQLEGRPDLRLVVLNACSTGAPPVAWSHDPSRSIAFALLKRGIPAVVATRLRINNSSAMSLAHGLYTALARGHRLETAVAEGRRRIAEGDEQASDTLFRWGIPLLYSQVQGNRLFEFTKPDGVEILRLAITTLEHSFQAKAQPLELDLRPSYSGRQLVPGVTWEQIRDRIYDFLQTYVWIRQEAEMRLDAYLSVSFTAGYCIGTTGCPITLLHTNRRTGEVERWRPSPRRPDRVEKGWDFEPFEETGGTDLVVAVGVSQPNVGKEVQAAWPLLAEGRAASFQLASLPAAHDAILDADHAFNLAEALAARIKEIQKGRKVHLFLATPATFAFYLGQISGFLGTIQLYEYDPVQKKYFAAIAVSPADRTRSAR